MHCNSECLSSDAVKNNSVKALKLELNVPQQLNQPLNLRQNVSISKDEKQQVSSVPSVWTDHTFFKTKTLFSKRFPNQIAPRKPLK